MDAVSAERRRGVAAVAAAYIAWGLLPFYWKALQSVPPPEILAHRVVWSFIFLLLLVGTRGRWPEVRATFAVPRTRRMVLFTALLIGVNWLTYITAINTDHVVEASLGYFINPLVSVLLGAVFLRERLDRWQGAAVVLAAAGVGWLTWRFGAVPWFALILAVTFGLYGLLRKVAAMGATAGLLAETGLLSPIALIYVTLMIVQGSARTGTAPLTVHLLLFFAGVVTAVPLLLFVSGVRRIPLSLAGFLQYISPTMQFLLGVFAFGEPFTVDHLAAFALIWTGLLVFSLRNAGVFAPRSGLG